MKLIPFDPRLAELVQPYYNEKEYSHWARGTDRHLTLIDCEHLPEIFNSEFLHIIANENAVGLIKLKQEAKDVYQFGIVLNKVLQKKGLGYKSVSLAEDYVANVKNGRIMICSTIDEWIGAAWVKRGWEKIGTIEKYGKCDGKYTDEVIFCKHLN